MRKLIISIKYFLFSFILSGLIFSNVIAETSQSKNSISYKDYHETFISYGIKDSAKIKKISDKCMNKFGVENFTIIGKGFVSTFKSEFTEQFLTCTNFEILQKIKPKQGNNLKKSKLEEFILNNEITFDDNSGKGILTYVFNKNGYEA